MVTENRKLISVDDVLAFEIECVHCGTKLLIPLNKCAKTAPQCSRCGTYWYRSGAADNEAIISLARAIEEIKSESKLKDTKFRFRIEIVNDEKKI
ncbi:MAG: hypothetical protein WA765_04345 [Candidatus Acidiferrum sp.]